MKKSIFTLSILSLALGLFSCGGGDQKTAPTETTTTTEETCTYTFKKEFTSIKWTAYKTTEKLGVSGEFEAYDITGFPESADAAEKAVVGAEVIIPVSTTKTGDAGRDQRIIEYFFGTFTDTDTIKAVVTSFNADGSGTIDITINGITKPVAFTGSIDGKKIVSEAVLDLSQFDGQAAIDALNEECKELHAGKDGVTKLWPDVKLEISADLYQECQ